MKPKCKMCGRKNTVANLFGNPKLWYCDWCKMAFDTEDDGGDYDDRNPAARMEREERARDRKIP